MPKDRSDSTDDDCEIVNTKIVTDELWFESLRPKELEWYTANAIPFDELEDRKVVCTACFKQQNHKQRGFLIRHPTLGVPVCKPCKNYYFDGAWSKDEEGKFEFCGWCAEGGDLLCCSSEECPNAFCTNCIKRNLGRKALNKVEETDDWFCFECKPYQLRTLRCLYYSLYQYWLHEEQKLERRLKAVESRKQNRTKDTGNKRKPLRGKDAISRSLNDLGELLDISKQFHGDEASNRDKSNDNDEKSCLTSAKRIFRFVAESHRNLDRLKSRLLDNLSADFGDDPDREAKLTVKLPERSAGFLGPFLAAAGDNDSPVVTNGTAKADEEATEQQKDLEVERVKLKVLQSSSSDEERFEQGSPARKAKATKAKQNPAKAAESDDGEDCVSAKELICESKATIKAEEACPDPEEARRAVLCDSSSSSEDEKRDASPKRRKKSRGASPKTSNDVGDDSESGKSVIFESGKDTARLPNSTEKVLKSCEGPDGKALLLEKAKLKVLQTSSSSSSENEEEEEPAKREVGLDSNEDVGTNPADASIDLFDEDANTSTATVEAAAKPSEDLKAAEGEASEAVLQEGSEEKPPAKALGRGPSGGSELEKDDAPTKQASGKEALPKKKTVFKFEDKSHSSESDNVASDDSDSSHFATSKPLKRKRPASSVGSDKGSPARPKKPPQKKTCMKSHKASARAASSGSELDKKSGASQLAVPKSEEASGESSGAESPDGNGRTLRRKFNEHIRRIKVAEDPKIQGTVELRVSVRRLEQKVLDRLEEDNTLRISENPGLDEVARNIRKFGNGSGDDAKKRHEVGEGGSRALFDAEINRLCSLGALDKMIRVSSRNKAPSNGNGQKRAKPKDDDDVEELSSDNEASSGDGERRGRLKEAVSRSASAKKSALASSSSSSNDDAEESDFETKKKGKKSSSREEGSKNGVARNGKSAKKDSDPSFMRVKMDASDSEEEMAKAGRRRDRAAAKKAAAVDSSDDEADIIEVPAKRQGKSKRRAKVSSDEEFGPGGDPDASDDDFDEEGDEENKAGEDSDSDFGVAKAKKKRQKKKKASSSSDDDDEEARPKKKRKRIKKNDDSSDEEEKSPSKGRKDIRKIIKDKNLSEGTKEAAEEEKERRKRVNERQALYNQCFEIKDNATVAEVPLDIDPDTKDVIVEIHKDLCKKLKPHQAGGVKFLWEAIFETKADVEDGKVPGGAILAHCMGLGKTLQTIGLIHTVMTNFPTIIQRSLILAPVNTIKNWEDEFHKWLKGDLDDIIVHEMSGEKDNYGRMDRLDYWHREGGVMIMGYDMYRNLTNDATKKFKKKQKEIFRKTLVEPGPDLVVCDEGHILKNTKSALNLAVNKIQTKRRIILTGTPLQNNLSEYYAMVNFVKPNLLGTYAEFKNRFVNPIANGQSSDSTDRDVRIMKKRSFILNDLLKGCMQRLDYNVLVPYLQPKHEYVLCICLTEFQKKLYRFYLEKYARAGQIGIDGKLEGGKKGGLFYDVQNLSRVWNHPYILLRAKEQADIKRMMADDDEADTNFINDDDDEESEAKSTSSGEDFESDKSDVEVKRRRVTRKNAVNDDKIVSGLDEVKAEQLAASKGWWSQFLDDPEDEAELERIELGSKMVLLMDILRECYVIGDKVLVFSQSLLSLDLIEKFLSRADESVGGTWRPGRDYFRMDGSTPPDTRKKWCNYFNKKSNTAMRLFLISTKAGGLGINLVAANRVIIFDASWNPAHDVQSIFRVYRFGQEKPVYIYRFLAKGTMEEKIYDRQITKQSLSARVVDEQQIERHFTMNELAELYTFNDEPKEIQPAFKMPQDKLLAELILRHKDAIWKIHDHDSLLENQVDEHLTEEERKAAWEEYEDEKKGIANMANTGSLNMNVMMQNINPEAIRNQYRHQCPHLTEDQLNHATRAYMMQIQSAFTGKAGYDKSHYQQEMARARSVQQQLYPGLYKSNNRQTEAVSAEDLAQQASQLQHYQKMLHVKRQVGARQALLEIQRQAQQQQLFERARAQQQARQVLVRASAPPAKRKPETITLEDDDDEDDDDAVQEIPDNSDDAAGEIVLDGTPEFEEYDEPAPSTSSRKRGRPRLDPKTSE